MMISDLSERTQPQDLRQLWLQHLAHTALRVIGWIRQLHNSPTANKLCSPTGLFLPAEATGYQTHTVAQHKIVQLNSLSPQPVSKRCQSKKNFNALSSSGLRL